MEVVAWMGPALMPGEMVKGMFMLMGIEKNETFTCQHTGTR